MFALNSVWYACWLCLFRFGGACFGPCGSLFSERMELRQTAKRISVDFVPDEHAFVGKREWLCAASGLVHARVQHVFEATQSRGRFHERLCWLKKGCLLVFLCSWCNCLFDTQCVERGDTLHSALPSYCTRLCFPLGIAGMWLDVACAGDLNENVATSG